MGYYNFNEHFWTAKTVCNPVSTKLNTRNTRNSRIRKILFVVCVAVWTPLLVQILTMITNTNQQKTSMNTDNSNGNCLMLKVSKGFQAYCSIQKQ